MTRSDGMISLVLLGGGFILWSLAFVALYATSSIGCQLGWEQISVGPFNLLRLVLAAVWTAHVLAHILAFAATWRFLSIRESSGRTKWRRLLRIGAGLNIAATSSTGLLAVPIIGSSMCI